MNMPLHLHDCIDFALLQDLQDALASSIGTTVVFADSRGVPITAPSGWNTSRKHKGADTWDIAAETGQPLHPEVSPAAVMLFVAGSHIGQWLVGGVLPQADPPDVQTCVFMPVSVRRKRVGCMGFDQQTVRDWPPEAFAYFGNLAKALAENIHENTGGKKWRPSPRFAPVYESPLHPGIAS